MRLNLSCMLFDQKEFEHIINASALKKGFKLFTANKLELLQKTSNTAFNFLIFTKPAVEISLQIKAEKILKYNCSCKDRSYCEHLAATIFYLQKEVFEYIPALKEDRRKTRNKKSVFENCLNKIKIALKPFNDVNKPKAQQINEIVKKMDIERENAVFFKEDFYFHLAIVLELPKMACFSYSNKENKLQELVKRSRKIIRQRLAGTPSAIEKEMIIEAAKLSLRSQPNFKAGVFSFLVCYATIFIKDKKDFEFLKSQLKKRSLNKNTLEDIDRKLIAELQLSIMHSKLLNKTYSVKNYISTIELPIALAELEFCNGKDEKGFKILTQSAESLKKNTNKYLDLVEEILRFAKERENVIIENVYLEKKFIYGFFIDENDLNYFFKLNEARIEEATSHLLERLKTESLFYTFDKMAVLLLRQNKINDLLEEIKKEKNKFRTLNAIANKILPDSDFIKLYIKHLSQAITEAKYPYFQEQIFNLARTYIDTLPNEQRNSLLKLFKEKMMYERQFLLYVNKLYPEN